MLFGTFKIMEEKIVFERYLYNNGVEFNDIKPLELTDLDFLVNRIVIFPSLRPLKLEKLVRLCFNYCNNTEFKQKLLDKSNNCYVLIYRLYKKGIFTSNDIMGILNNVDSLIFCYYFRNEINDFKTFILNKNRPYDFDDSFVENENDIDLLSQYGFLPSSIEYCLKNDDISALQEFSFVNRREAKWSPFEWSYKPDYLDFLSFAGFFGSIKCFEHLLKEGYEINDNVKISCVCSGSIEIFHLIKGTQSVSADYVCKSSVFNHLGLLTLMLETGISVDIKNCDQWTPLHWASYYGHLRIVEYLVKHGAIINSKDNGKKTPLHYSAQNGHLCVVEFLINHGADLKTKDSCFKHKNSIIPP